MVVQTLIEAAEKGGKPMTIRMSVVLALVMLVATPGLGDWEPQDGHKMHFPQLPDPLGWDVAMTYPKVLADDWQCSESGFVDDVHFWVSWKGDEVGEIANIHLSIHDNDANLPSKPGVEFWSADFGPTDFVIRQAGTGEQGWYNPNTGEWIPGDHFTFYQINIMHIDDKVGAFYQEVESIYWLDISVTVAQAGIGPTNGVEPSYEIGWKTSPNHWMDDAVWGDYPEPTWQELLDPITEQSLDLAFVITPEPTTFGMLMLGGLALLRRRWR